MADTKSLLQKNPALEKNVQYYLGLAKKLIDETKITSDPKQDNFIKGVCLFSIEYQCIIPLIAGLIFLLLVSLITGNGAEIFITLVSFVYPGYMSIKAILSQDTEDDQRWLKYWVLVSVLMVFQVAGDCLLSWVPGYCLAKASLLIWCQAPLPDNGSVLLFNSVLSLSSHLP